MSPDQLNDLIYKISEIPGIVSFATLDENFLEIKNNEEWEKAISIEKIGQKIRLKIAFIISVDLPLKPMLNQIQAICEYYLKQKKMSLETMNCYVVGAR